MIAHHLQQRTGFFDLVFHTPSSRPERNKTEASTEHLLKDVGLTRAGSQLAENLPHGLQRVLGVTLALAAKPELLLLDEPITGMTHQETKAITNLIRELNGQGLTVLLVEHNLREVMKICHRVLVINFGKKLTEGLPEEVRNNKEVIEAYLGG
jgi:branched-chain amino acid transport system ATP-binding protein